MKLDLEDPIATLLAAVEALDAARLECAVYGGLALAIYGEARETKDADLAVVGVSAESACDALRTAGLDASVTFEEVRFGGNRVSRITLLPGDQVTGLNTVDLVEPRSPSYAKAAATRAIAGALRGQSLRVLSPEDFILFKVLSTRDRDVEDAASVLRELRDRLDHGLLEQEATQLALQLPEHDVMARLERARASSRISAP
jgi:hypothetical protein